MSRPYVIYMVDAAVSYYHVTMCINAVLTLARVLVLSTRWLSHYESCLFPPFLCGLTSVFLGIVVLKVQYSNPYRLQAVTANNNFIPHMYYVLDPNSI